MQTSNNILLCLVLVDASAVLQRDVQLSRFPKLIEPELYHIALILLYTPVHNSSVTLFYIWRVSHVLQCHAGKAYRTSSFGHIFTGSDVREGMVGDRAGLGMLTWN